MTEFYENLGYKSHSFSKSVGARKSVGAAATTAPTLTRTLLVIEDVFWHRDESNIEYKVRALFRNFNQWVHGFYVIVTPFLQFYYQN